MDRKRFIADIYKAINSGSGWDSTPGKDLKNIQFLNRKRFSMMLLDAEIKSPETLPNDIHRLALHKLGSRANKSVKYIFLRLY